MGSVTYPEHQATPDEYEYLMLRGFYDSLGSRRYFEKSTGETVRGYTRRMYIVAKPNGWIAGLDGTGGNRSGSVFPDVVTAFVDAEISNWWRS